jgi:hypothetical protein
MYFVEKLVLLFQRHVKILYYNTGIEHILTKNVFYLFFQTVINGFDPDKFRRVNNKNGPSFDSEIRIERRIQSPASASFQIPASMPGVPSYDPTEKQLLATIEQELGVL